VFSRGKGCILRTYACDEFVVEVASEVCAHDYCAVIRGLFLKADLDIPPG
jgi:hypothetical protein